MFLECNSMSWQHHFPFEQCTDFDPDFAFVLAQSIFVPIRSIRQDGRGAIFASQNSSCFVRFAMRIDLWAFDSSLHPTVATASNLLCWQRSCLLPTMETRSEESQFEWSSHDNASLMSPGRAYHVPPPPDGDSNDGETDEVPSLTHSTPFDSADTGPRSSPIWTCVECKNTNWNWMAAGWRCSRCGCEKFYDACHYGDSNDSGGTWIFVPHEAADHDRHSMERKPDDPGAPSSVGERAEIWGDDSGPNGRPWHLETFEPPSEKSSSSCCWRKSPSWIVLHHRTQRRFWLLCLRLHRRRVQTPPMHGEMTCYAAWIRLLQTSMTRTRTGPFRRAPVRASNTEGEHPQVHPFGLTAEMIWGHFRSGPGSLRCGASR